MIYRKEENMKTTLNPFENAKRTANGTGGVSPSVIEEIQTEISALTSAYSTTEHKTGRKWTDGKDIYEKTYHYENGIALTNAGADSGIPYTNFDKIINCRAVGNNCQFVSCNTFYSSTNIRVSVHEPLTVYDIIFEYTKPTA